MFHLFHEFPSVAVAHDLQHAIVTDDLDFPRDKGAGEHDLFGALADIDEAAGASKARPEFRNVERAGLIGLCEAQKCDVEAATVVEIELVGLVDHRLRVDRCAEIDTARGYAADHAGLCRERDKIGDLFFVGDGGDAFGHADAEIDDAVWFEFERRAPRDDLSRAVFHRRQGTCARADLRGIGRIVLRGESLPVVFRPGHYDAIYQHARHFHLTRIERAAFGNALNLRDHDAAGITRGHGDGERFERQRLLFHCQIAVGVAGRSPDDADIDRESCRRDIPRRRFPSGGQCHPSSSR